MTDTFPTCTVPTPIDALELNIGKRFFQELQHCPVVIKNLLHIDEPLGAGFRAVQQIALRALRGAEVRVPGLDYLGCVWVSPTLGRGPRYQPLMRLWLDLAPEVFEAGGLSQYLHSLTSSPLEMYTSGRSPVSPWALPTLAIRDQQAWQLWSQDRTGPVRMSVNALPDLKRLEVTGVEPNTDDGLEALPGLRHALAVNEEGIPYCPQRPCRPLMDGEDGPGPRRVQSLDVGPEGVRYEVMLADAPDPSDGSRNVRHLASFDDPDEALDYAEVLASEPVNGAPQETDSILIYDHEADAILHDLPRPCTGDWQ